MLTAYKLTKRGQNVVLIDAETVGSGVTKNTTAKITSQHRPIYHRLISSRGIEAAKAYAKSNENAIREYEQIISELNIDCDFKKNTAYVYSTCDKELIRREMNAALMCGIDAFYTEDSDLPFKIKAMYGFKNQAEFDPLKFLFAVAKKLTVFEHTRAIDIENSTVITNRGKISAKHIVVATHYPFYNKSGLYFMRLSQQRSYVAAVKTDKDINGMYISAEPNGFSFRRAGDVILLGGCSHRVGDPKENCRERLFHASKLYFPRTKITHCWSAQDCMSIDGVPFIGRYGQTLPRTYVATGFGKWGMTGSMVAADVLTDLIMTNKSRYEKLYTPQRFVAGASFKNLSQNAGYSSSGMFKRYFRLPQDTVDSIRAEKGMIINYGGKKLGVYKDKDGKLFAVTPVCPHMGCELAFNSEEKSWDCPCHGSRFDIHGKCLDNPANRNLGVYSINSDEIK